MLNDLDKRVQDDEGDDVVKPNEKHQANDSPLYRRGDEQVKEPINPGKPNYEAKQV